MTASTGFWLIPLSAMLSVACRRAPEPPRGAPLPRCYRLAVGPWNIPQDVQFSEQRYVPPTPQLLILDPVRTPGLLGMPPADKSPLRRVRAESSDTAWTAFERQHALRAWEVKGDSLRVMLSTGFSGLSMDFGIVGDSLFGRAEVISDVSGIDFPTAPARGARVTCPPQ